MSVVAGPKIITDGLVFSVDNTNSKSYNGAGNSWSNLIDNYSSTGSSTPSIFNNPSWSSGMTSVTAFCAITVLGNDTAYAYHPLNKWVNTTDATFVLYHFQNFQNNNDQNNFGWYANRGGTWDSISDRRYAPAGSTYVFTLQYNSTNGGQMWTNGSKSGVRRGSGVLGTTTNPIQIDGGPAARDGIHQVRFASIYNKELSDNDIIQNFNATRGRYGI
jgi:hypothetical protein